MKTKNNYIEILAGLIFILLILFHLFVIPKADDFVFFFKIKNLGFLKFLKNQYNTWSGAAYSIYGIIDYFLFYISKDLFRAAKIFTILWTINLFIASYFIVKLYSHYSENQLTKKQLFIYTSIISGILWINTYINLGDTLYWLNGGYYSIILLFTILWIFILERKPKHEFIFAFILSFFLGSAGARSFSVFFVYLFFFFMKNFVEYKNPKKIILFLFSYFIPFFIGFWYTNKAPGSLIRIKALGGLEDNFFFILINYIKIIDYLLHQSLKYIIISAVFLLLLFVTSFKKLNINIFYSFRWLIIALALPLPFAIFKGGYMPLRSFSLFFLSISLFLSEFIFIFISNYDVVQKLKREINPHIQIILMLAIIMILSYNLIAFGKYYTNYLHPYINYLNSKRYHEAAIKSLYIAPPLKYNFTLRENPKDWRNRYMAKYFKIKQISFDISCIKQTPYYLRTNKSYTLSKFSSILKFHILNYNIKYGPITIKYLKNVNDKL